MQPKISIIIPVFNAEKTIGRCIDSILKQDYSSIEIFLINDGSKDNSGKICDEFAQKHDRIQVFHQKNQGVSHARNKGLDMCTGDYILFVDSDDYLEQHCLSQLIAYPTADITYMSSNVHYPTGDITSYHLRPTYLTTQTAIEEEILHLKVNPQGYVYFGYTWNKLFKASIIKEHNIRFIEGLNFYEDDAFTLEFFQYAQSLRTIPTCLYNYIINENGLTMASNSCEEFETFIDANIKNMQFIKHKELYNYELHRLFDFLLQATRQAKRQNRKAMYNHLIKKAHKFYLDFIRPNNIWIRKVYRQKYFCLFLINIVLHKR